MERRTLLQGLPLAMATLAANPASAMDRGGTQTVGTGHPDGRLSAGGFSRDDFERYVDCRYGTGGPVFWYGWGGFTTVPGGQMFARTEGYEVGRLYRPNPDEPEVHLLNRKLMVFRNPQTGEAIQLPDGSPMWLSDYTYQHIRTRLEDGRLSSYAEQGVGDAYGEVTGGQNTEVQHFEDMSVFTTPAQYSIDWNGEQPVWETYHWIERRLGDKIVYDGVWAGDFPLPPGFPPGRGTMHAYFHRYDAFETLPGTIRAFVEEYAPLWKAPPADMDEIERCKAGECAADA